MAQRTRKGKINLHERLVLFSYSMSLWWLGLHQLEEQSEDGILAKHACTPFACAFGVNSHLALDKFLRIS